MPLNCAINPKLYEKTCCRLLIINLVKLTVHYNKYMFMYEIGTFMIYKFTVYCIVYSKLLQVTDQSVSYYTIALLTASLFFNQSES